MPNKRLAVLLFSAFTALTCPAQEVHFTFSGDVMQADAALGIPLSSTFTGEFSYDLSGVPYFTGTTADGNTANYHDGSLSVTFGGITVSTLLPAQLTVNDNAYAGYDSLSVTGLPTMSVVGSPFGVGAFFAGFNDATGSSFSSIALPGSLGSLFNDNILGVLFTSGAESYFLSGKITNVQAVPAIPEPSTYALMLAGMAAVGYAARRRRQVR